MHVPDGFPSCTIIVLLLIMYRLAVYNYLTRCTGSNTGSGRLIKKRLSENKRCKIGPVDSLNKCGQLSHTTSDTQRQPGPPFQDLMSGWEQPESDNKVYDHLNCIILFDRTVRINFPNDINQF